MVRRISAGPYELVIVPAERPFLTADGLLDGLANIIHGATGQPSAAELRANPIANIGHAIRSRSEGGNAMVSIRPAYDEQEANALYQAWLTAGGVDSRPDTIACIEMANESETLAIPWTVLESAIETYVAFQEAWAPSSKPSLFTSESTDSHGTSADFRLIAELGAELKEIDGFDYQAQVGAEDAVLLAKRQTFLRKCERMQVLSDDLRQERTDALYWWRSPLLALRQSALHLHGWAFSPPGLPIIDGPICLDYIRHRLWPPGEDGYEWARSVLNLVQADEPEPQGSITEHVAGVTTQVFWRRDGRRAALLAVHRNHD